MTRQSTNRPRLRTAREYGGPGETREVQNLPENQTASARFVLGLDLHGVQERHRGQEVTFGCNLALPSAEESYGLEAASTTTCNHKIVDSVAGLRLVV